MGKKKTTGSWYKSCKHGVLKLGKGELYGGSCLDPKVKGCDVYVSLESSVSKELLSDPWDDWVGFLYAIRNFDVPSDKARFKKMIAYLSECLGSGQKVHVGCMAGHGRTGMVLAALVKEMTGEKDAIMYVRKNYCHKAVETPEQVRFMVDQFGVKKVPARYGSGGSSESVYEGTWNKKSRGKITTIDDYRGTGLHSYDDLGVPAVTLRPRPIKGSIW